MKHKTLQMAVNLLEAGTAPDTVKKLLGIDDRKIIKALQMTKLTTERFRAIIKQAKAHFTFFPEYTLYHNIFRDMVLVSSNTVEVLEYVQRHAGGEFQQDNKLLIKIEE